VVSGSTFMGESQPGQVPLHRTRHGLMPPGQIETGWFQVSFLSNPLWENPDGLVPTHMEGHEGNLPVGTQIRSLRMSDPLDGALDAPAAGHPLCHFIPRSGCPGQL
jgi:hypothetical protein